jgi:hypothetical protein
MDEQTTANIYKPPVLVELGQFDEDTLGFGQNFPDIIAVQEW